MSCECHSYDNNLLDAKAIIDLLSQSCNNGNSFSLTRFSHAELACLNWKVNPQVYYLMKEIEDYNGVTEPIKKVYKKLIQSLFLTDVVGLIPQSNTKIATAERDLNGSWWYDITTHLLHQFSFTPKMMCSVWITQELIYEERFWEFLKNKRIALIGRRAPEAVKHFNNFGVVVSEVLTLGSIQEVKGVYNHLSNRCNNWDVALVSAGIPSTILTPQLAKATNKIVIDFGHALDRIIDKEQYNFDQLYKNWKGN
jgi:hypothetical protein